jgi:hypothetical protein
MLEKIGITIVCWVAYGLDNVLGAWKSTFESVNASDTEKSWSQF